MPNLNGAGPLGQKLMTGRSIGMGRERDKGMEGKRHGGSKECTCPKCGYKEPHTRGIPCSEKKCPKCGTLMKGVFCS